jgi:DNA-binding transcriptional regulator YiaG
MKKKALKRKGYKHITWVGDHKVEDSTRMVLQDRDGNVELTYDELVGYERRAARLVLQDVKAVEGAVLKFARKALNLRQEDLAGILDYTPSEISRFENDNRPIPRTLQFAVADLLCRVETQREQVLEMLLDSGRKDPPALEVRRLRRVV